MTFVKREYLGVDSHHMEDGTQHNNANCQNEEPTDVGLLQHQWPQVPKEDSVHEVLVGTALYSERRSDAARSASSVYPSPMASWSLQVADTGEWTVDTHLQAKTPFPP